jgi:hypothetical protein
MDVFDRIHWNNPTIERSELQQQIIKHHHRHTVPNFVPIAPFLRSSTLSSQFKISIPIWVAGNKVKKQGLFWVKAMDRGVDYLAPRLRKEYRYICIPPLSIRGFSRSKCSFNFTLTHGNLLFNCCLFNPYPTKVVYV